jgi:hypothetical protein
MTSYRIYDHESDEKLLPEEESGEVEGFGYSTPEEALNAYQEHFEEPFYEENQIRIQELERIGWVDLQNLPSRREIIERAEAEAFQQLEEEIDEN